MSEVSGFTFEGFHGNPALSLGDFEGKAVLVVNTASACGFTPQYKGLEALWKEWQGRGLIILGVPCNDFGGQEPGSDAEIAQFCEINYGVSFPLTAKTKVTGEDAHPFYRFAREKLGWVAAPKWNFHKYLIDGKGELVDWFSSVTAPDAVRLRSAVEAVLPDGKTSAA